MNSHNHIILPEQTRTASVYSPWGKGRNGGRIPVRDKEQHGEFLTNRLESIWNSERELERDRTAVALPTRDGTYVQFKGPDNCDLAIENLESRRAGVRLMNVRQIEDNEVVTQLATVYIPAGEESFFMNKLEKYKTELTRTGKPRNDTLFRSIEDIQIATLAALWTGKQESFPTEQNAWYEVWIHTEVSEDKGESQCTAFVESLRNLRIEVKGNALLFQERAVILVRGNVRTLTELMCRFGNIAEFRPSTTPASFWTNESKVNQNEWIQDLLHRMIVNQEHDVLVCMLDSGINNGHPLLKPIVPDDNCLTNFRAQGSSDPVLGHGTLMAGIIEFENLESKLESSDSVTVTNRLCSVKILPNIGYNEPDMYGDVTQQAIYRAEITFPNDRKIYCMAVTADASEYGLPSSWSGAADQLVYNDGNLARLMIVSAGNIRFEDSNFAIWNAYPKGASLRTIEDPAQAWNVLTVGAFTEKIAPDEMIEYDRVAAYGEISPFSRTSALWHKSSPIKPEIVMEGGNLLKTHVDGIPYTTDECVEALSTNARYQLEKPFSTINATSLSTALASAVASRLMQKYPNYWPETVRGLLVHNAEWTEAMNRQFPATTRKDMNYRLRSVGYGVPKEERLLSSFDNAFTLVTQASLQPFYKKRKSSTISLNEMHYIELPWPADILRGLGETPAKLKITLSYFIEPSPGEIGWKSKYRYQSCGLRFDVNDVNESFDAFKVRVNKLMCDDENQGHGRADSNRWKIGVNNRDVGSIHSDYIEDTAINLAECHYVAVYPVGGWWKNRPYLNKYNKSIRYSLIVSLETPSQEVDLYNVVMNAIENIVAIPIAIDND